ncbi:unnamed protein product [Parajaminaea phylloscopi]
MASNATAVAAPRQEMISSAISFLQDPKVASSSVAQRIAFLESKGLTSGEIDEALGRSGVVGGNGPGAPPPQQHQQPYAYAQASQQPYGPRALYPPHMAQQQAGPSRDWRDWFIMAVVSGTIGYGVVALARKYLFPHLQPPNQTILESDRDALTAKYDEVAATLAELDAETRAVKEGLEQQKSAIDAELKQVESALEQLRSGERARKEEMERVGREVDAMKRELPKMFESSSASTATTLTELQNELKSLRSLLVSRTAINSNGTGGAGTAVGAGGANGVANGSRPGTGFSSPRTGNASPPPPPLGVGQSGSKPSIPAWQLAASEGEAAGSNSNSTTTTTSSSANASSSDSKTDKLSSSSSSETTKEGGYEV